MWKDLQSHVYNETELFEIQAKVSINNKLYTVHYNYDNYDKH